MVRCRRLWSNFRSITRYTAISCVVLAVWAQSIIVSGAQAQSAGDGFLFRRSPVQLSLKGGIAHPFADSEIFDFTTEQLTLNRGDFDSFTVGADAAFSIGSRLSVTVGLGLSRSHSKSEFRDWVDNNNEPIEQYTIFERVPLTLGIRQYLISPGESIGVLAWVPNGFAPYFAIGGGLIRYSFRQYGDWVDFRDRAVFKETFQSGRTTPMAYVGAGADVSLSAHFGLTSEARATWARGTMEDSFVGFDSIDLSGTSITAGVFYRF